MSIEATRVRNRDALSLEQVQELFVRAFKADNHADAQEAWAWCGAMLLNENVALFVTLDDENQLIGMMILQWNDTVWCRDPFVLHLYSETRESTVALGVAAVAWCRELGQTSFQFVNASRHTDERFLHSGEGFISASKTLGSVIRCELEGDSE